jgi:hypothetical protein
MPLLLKDLTTPTMRTSAAPCAIEGQPIVAAGRPTARRLGSSHRKRRATPTMDLESWSFSAFVTDSLVARNKERSWARAASRGHNSNATLGVEIGPWKSARSESAGS